MCDRGSAVTADDSSARGLYDVSAGVYYRDLCRMRVVKRVLSRNPGMEEHVYAFTDNDWLGVILAWRLEPRVQIAACPSG
jgi:hypothetical protein